MCKVKNKDDVNIDVNIGELVLTPLSCAVLINEIIKYLIYQKSQIPYPYNWLQSVIARKKNSKNDEIGAGGNLSVERHYKVVLAAYDTLEEIMDNIRTEFMKRGSVVEEISVLFGTTPYSLKEAFTIRIPRIAVGHNELNHSSLIRKNHHKILRNIFFSEDWLDAVKRTVSLTNMFVMLKKRNESGGHKDNNFFDPIHEFSLPNKVRNVTVNFRCDFSQVHSCCCNLSVFEDSCGDKTAGEKSLLSTSEEEPHMPTERTEGRWYQARLLFKGYKDCFINKMSASQLF